MHFEARGYQGAVVGGEVGEEGVCWSFEEERRERRYIEGEGGLRVRDACLVRYQLPVRVRIGGWKEARVEVRKDGGKGRLKVAQVEGGNVVRQVVVAVLHRRVALRA